MIDDNGVIQAPVSIEDINEILGVGSYDLGTLCTSSKINKWAKYKPVWFPSLKDEDGSYKAKYSYSPPGNHSDGDHGLAPSNIYNYSSNSSTNNANKKAASLEDWDYATPQGGNYSPYRLTDFIGYTHETLPPLYMPIRLQKVTVNTVSNTSYTYYLDWLEAGDFTGGVGIEDISQTTGINFKRTKLSAIAYKSNTVFGVYESTGYIVDSYGYIDDYAITIKNIGGISGDIQVYFFLTYYPESGHSIYFPLPNLKMTSVTMPVTLTLDYNTGGAGLLIDDWEYDVWYSPTNQLSSNSNKWMQAAYLSDGSIASHIMYNYTRNLAVKIKFTNTSNSAKTIYRSELSVSCNDSSLAYASIEEMYDFNSASYVSSFIVPANGTKIIGLYRAAVFPNASGNNWVEYSLEYKKNQIYSDTIAMNTTGNKVDGFYEW